jgi:diadenosine tetraphosphatase ApaH/serine/threonine PP2A family protein phosphatase
VSADLGALDGPLLLFGGNYSNRQATEALIAEAARLGIAPDHVICTGDVVAYCAEPQATVDLMRAWGAAVVMGNCEESLAAGAADCGCGFAEGTMCSALSGAWYRYSLAHLDREAAEWMGTLPRAIRFSMAGWRFLCVHGGVRTINRFVFASQTETIAEELGFADADAVVAGHCGVPFTARVGDRVWHNAGALGMPTNDGTPRVWYSLLTHSGDGLRIERRPLAYDHAAAAAAMRKAGLPEGYARGLETGLWPSEDVLPAAERARRGQPIMPDGCAWSSPRRRAAPAPAAA